MSTSKSLNQSKKGKQKTRKEGACREEATKGNGQAKVAVEPIANAAQSVTRLRLPPEELLKNLGNITTEIGIQTHELKTGDLSKVEEMLYAQAVTLDAAFHKFLAMAAGCTGQATLMGQRFEMITGLAAMAFKAQEQSRKTLVALAELKNPKHSTTFIKNYVDKQLNHLSVDEPPNQPKLQEDTHAEMDTRSEREAKAADTEVAAVAEVIGSEHGAGKSNQRQKQH